MLTPGQAVTFSLQVALIGMAIVFIALVALVFLFKLMSFIVVKAKSRGEGEAAQPVNPNPAPVVPLAAAPIAAAALADEEDEIAAVIAAVMAVCQDSNTGLVVRSVRRVGNNAPAWNLAGRNNLI